MTSSKEALQHSDEVAAYLLSKAAPIAARTGMPLPHIPTPDQTLNFISPSRAGELVLAAQTKGKSATADSTDKLQGSDLVREQLATESAKLLGAGKAGGSGRHWWDDWAENTLNVGSTAIDYLNRPSQALSSATYEAGQQGEKKKGADEYKPGDNMWSQIWNRGLEGFFNEPKAKTWEDVIKSDPDYQGMSGGWQKSTIGTGGGLAASIALDPLTPLSAGATTLGKGAALAQLAKLTEESGPIARGVGAAAEAAIATSEKGGTVAKNVKPLASAEIKTKVLAAAAEKSKLKYIMDDVKKQVKKESDDLEKRTGHYMPPADRAARESELAMQATEPFQKQMTSALVASQKRRFAVRVVGHDILGGKVGSKIGRAAYRPFEIANKGLGKTLPIKGLKQAFQVGDHFPGLTNQIRRLAESRGIVQHEIESRKIDKLLKGISKDTQEQIYKDLERGVRTEGVEADKDLGKIYDKFDEMRREQFNQMVEAGVMEPNQAVENYVPQFYRRGSTDDIKEFKNNRKLAIQGKKGLASDYGLQAAKDAGLHPYSQVGDAFKLYDADVTRKLVRRNNQVGLVNQYGIRAKSDAAGTMKAAGLKDASELMKPADREAMKALGESMWMHPEILKTQNAMDKMLKAGNHEELNRLMRLADRVTNWWKRTATVWNPGNWFNNSLGDMTMNFIDGVQDPRDYFRVGKMLMGKGANMKIPLGKGLEIDSGLFRKLYQDYSSGAGFLRADVGTDVLSRASSVISKGFEGREDFGRMTHFMHALRDELSRTGDLRGLNRDLSKYLAKNPAPGELLKTPWGRKLAQAATAAGERVSKWNIDYSAFTPFERKIKKVIPFYAWQRKSIPLLLEAMATKPGRVNAIRHTQDAISQALGGDFREQQGKYNVAYPDWMRQSGFMRLSKGKEPWIVQDPTPFAMLGKTLSADSPSALLRQQMGGLTPFLKDPIELATHQQLFSGKKLPDNMGQYWESQLPFMSTAGFLGGTDVRGTDMTPMQRIMGLAGTKPYKVTDKLQAGELQRQKDPLDARLSKVNDALKNSRVGDIELTKVKDGYKVYNKSTKTTYGVMADPGQAMALAVRIAGLNK